MIYNNDEEYKAYYYQNSHSQKVPVLDYIQHLPQKEEIKIITYIKFLENRNGHIDEPYGRYIGFGIRELRIVFSSNNHRIFYVIVSGKKIILLHAFLKKTRRTPQKEIKQALNNFNDYKLNRNIIKYEKS